MKESQQGGFSPCKRAVVGGLVMIPIGRVSRAAAEFLARRKAEYTKQCVRGCVKYGLGVCRVTLGRKVPTTQRWGEDTTTQGTLQTDYHNLPSLKAKQSS